MRPAYLLTMFLYGGTLLSTNPGCAASTLADKATQPTAPSSFAQRLADARTIYFRDISGDSDAHAKARQAFTTLAQQQPGNTVVKAYMGSLDLLDAARTWAVWDKHALSQQGLRELDQAVDLDPSSLETRFIRAATTLHLPFFFHRHEQAESDFAYIAPRAAAAVASGTLPPQLGAAALDYYGQLLSEKSNHAAARDAFQAAVRIDETSPGGKDASRRLKQID